MDIKVEHIEGHVAQLTVKVEPSQTLAAKQKAARRISQKYRIPGFRPGKAPYQVVVNMFGEQGILEEAIEDIGNTVYASALEASEVDAIAPGEIVKVDQQEDTLVMVFNVPKAAEVDLKNYRELRRELKLEPVTDEVVTDAMENLRESRALVEDVSRAAKVGDELELDLRVVWWHADDAHEHDEHEHDHEEHDHEHDEHEHDHDTDDAHHGKHPHALIDDRDAKVVLRPEGDKRDMLPGFSAQLVGLSAEEEKSFTLVLPDDFEDESLAGQSVEATLQVKAVRARTVPEMNDTFAAAATENEVQTLLDLRIKMRQDLEKMAQERAEQELSDDLVSQIIAQAEVQYHETNLRGYVDALLQNMDQALRQRANVSLDQFIQMTGQSREALETQYRENALANLRRDVVIGKLLDAEKISIELEEIQAEIAKMSERYGEQAAVWKSILDTPEMRQEIAARLLNEKMVKRMVAIGTGQNPPLADPAE